ncbi:MAG: hypothetical protein LBP52_06970, partial [Burkholderiaceae bacterium]|nr:hypothetical protein [Burkholderiaceae bacterium]
KGERKAGGSAGGRGAHKWKSMDCRVVSLLAMTGKDALRGMPSQKTENRRFRMRFHRAACGFWSLHAGALENSKTQSQNPPCYIIFYRNYLEQNSYVSYLIALPHPNSRIWIF